MTTQEQQLRQELMLTQLASTGVNPQKNYFVEAGAGAGKTYILVQRIVNQLVSGLYSPQELVAITFTKKATQELSGRLSQELQSRLQGEQDEKKAQHLQTLIDQLGQMQISTIHGFCQTLLASMPFETPLGVDWQVAASDQSAIETAFNDYQRHNPQAFALSDLLCIKRNDLLGMFKSLCQANYDTVVRRMLSDKDMQLVRQLMEQVGHQQLPVLKLRFTTTLAHRDRTMLSADFLKLLQSQSLTPEQALHLTAQLVDDPKVFLGAYTPQIADLRTQLSLPKKNRDPAYSQAHPIFEAMDETIHDTKVKPFSTDYAKQFPPFYHAVAMDVLTPILTQYKGEKLAEKRVVFDDLMIYTRDMLENSAMARAYFRQRYKTIYVDELQDTDPLQAEILFYLASADDTCIPQDWTKCNLRPDSLFLVGDPKQGIYRFRGADISIYNQIKEIFTSHQQAGGSETVVELQANFRSDQVICTFVDDVFAQGKPHQLGGGAYQAQYRAMTPEKGASGYGQVLTYATLGEGDARKENDPQQIAAFIQAMVAHQVPLGQTNGKKRTAQYKDFLILPYTRKEVARYEKALTALNIPTATTGSQSFLDADVIAKGVLLLGAVAEPDNHLALVQVLTQCYQVSLSSIHRYLQLCTSSAAYQLRNPNVHQGILDTLGQSAEDLAVAQLCAISAQLSALYAKSSAMPPMAVAELVFDGGYHLWQPKETRFKHNEFALVQQFLNALRSGAPKSLQDLYRQAVNCGNEEIEYQLSLEFQGNCVRIMNLHKAKGLEGAVVILPYHSKSTFPPTSHMERSQTRQLYQCLSAKRGVKSTVIGIPPNWENQGPKAKPTVYGKGAVEGLFLGAEQLRLLYVAATRAETMLVINDGDRQVWRPLMSGCGGAPAIPDRMQSAVFALTTGQAVAAKTVEAVETLKPVTLPDTNQMVATVCQGTRYAISPSQLDAQAPRHKATQEDATLQSNRAPEESTAQIGQWTYVAPYGNHWGTIVHRVLELAIRNDTYEPAQMQGYSRQAIWETLHGLSLSATEAKRLFGQGGGTMSEGQIEWLVDKVVEATAFANDPTHPLRKLLAQGAPFPELSFFAGSTQGALYDHFHAFVHKPEAAGKALDVQGFIDLAIATPEGWVIVDYKTNQKQGQQSQMDFEAGLKDHYLSQLVAYGKLLAQDTAQPVVGLYVCAIHTGGTLVEIPFVQ